MHAVLPSRPAKRVAGDESDDRNDPIKPRDEGGASARSEIMAWRSCSGLPESMFRSRARTSGKRSRNLKRKAEQTLYEYF